MHMSDGGSGQDPWENGAIIDPWENGDRKAGKHLPVPLEV